MGRAEDTSSGSSGRRLKVGRLIDEYDLQPLGAELERRWTADGDARSSLRDLATAVNRRLLETAMTEAGMHPLDGEVENVYRLLTADDVTDGDRTRIRRRLERNGVDMATLLDDFVTYQAVRTYLKDHRDAEYTRPNRDRMADCAEQVQRLRGRVTTVMSDTLDRLCNADEITLGEHRTLVDVTILCEDCGFQADVVDMLEEDGCACAGSTDQ